MKLLIAGTDGKGSPAWDETEADIAVRIEPILIDETPAAHIVHAVLPADVAGVGTTYRVATAFSVGDQSDSAPVIEGSSTPFDYTVGPAITIEPLTVSERGDSVVVTGQSFSPGTTALMVAGRIRLDDVAVADDGTFEVSISYADLVEGQSVQFPDGSGATHVRVYDESVGGDSMTVTLAK